MAEEIQKIGSNGGQKETFAVGIHFKHSYLNGTAKYKLCTIPEGSIITHAFLVPTVPESGSGKTVDISIDNTVVLNDATVHAAVGTKVAAVLTHLSLGQGTVYITPSAGLTKFEGYLVLNGIEFMRNKLHNLPE